MYTDLKQSCISEYYSKKNGLKGLFRMSNMYQMSKGLGYYILRHLKMIPINYLNKRLYLYFNNYSFIHPL